MAGFRRLIIKTAEVLIIILIVLITVGTAISTATSLHQIGGGEYWILGLIAGAVLGFLGAAILAAYFFLLMEIAENTRK
jgi:hypothetical protein